MEKTTSRSDMMMMQQQKKKTLGKQKIEMKRIEKMNYRYVTFSKRRAGLFKKAAELCLQTGADVVALVTSPGNHTFAFTSQPNLEDLLRHVIPGNRYDAGPTRSSLPPKPLYGSHHNEENEMIFHGDDQNIISGLNERYRKLTAALEEEEKMMMMGEEDQEQGGRKFWWEEEIEVERMGKEELECYVRALGEVKSNVEKVLMEKKNIHVVEKMLMMEEISSNSIHHVSEKKIMLMEDQSSISNSNMDKILMEKGYFIFPN